MCKGLLLEHVWFKPKVQQHGWLLMSLNLWSSLKNSEVAGLVGESPPQQLWRHCESCMFYLSKTWWFYFPSLMKFHPPLVWNTLIQRKCTQHLEFRRRWKGRRESLPQCLMRYDPAYTWIQIYSSRTVKNQIPSVLKPILKVYWDIKTVYIHGTPWYFCLLHKSGLEGANGNIQHIKHLLHLNIGIIQIFTLSSTQYLVFGYSILK